MPPLDQMVITMKIYFILLQFKRQQFRLWRRQSTTSLRSFMKTNPILIQKTAQIEKQSELGLQWKRASFQQTSQQKSTNHFKLSIQGDHTIKIAPIFMVIRKMIKSSQAHISSPRCLQSRVLKNLAEAVLASSNSPISNNSLALINRVSLLRSDKISW